MNREQFSIAVKDVFAFYEAMGFERLPIPVKPVISRNSASGARGAALDALRSAIGDCRKCKLSQQRTHIVFGEGNANARLMFIGEAPGREEDLQARPFVGEAGTLLTRLIEKMGFTRADVYIANIVKCRPPMNRDPDPEEIEMCRGFVEKQIEIIQPKVIMSLGRISSQTLTGDTKLKITAVRGRRFDFKGIPMIPTFHPAYLIRTPKDKWLTWADAQKVLELLGNKEVR